MATRKQPTEGVGTPEDGPKRKGRKRPSKAQVEANRRNAKASTGPRSVAGKRRVSANRTTHGIYAQILRPISTGPLAEDAEEFAAYVAGIVDGLDPRDGLEQAHAERIALCYVRLRRADRVEVELISAASALSVYAHSDPKTLQERADIETEIAALEAATEGRLDQDGYQALFGMIRKSGVDLPAQDTGDDRTWEDRLVEAGIAGYGSRAAFTEGFSEIMAKRALLNQMMEQHEWRAFGDHLLETILAPTTALQQRLGAELFRHYQTYEKLRGRQDWINVKSTENE